MEFFLRVPVAEEEEEGASCVGEGELGGDPPADATSYSGGGEGVGVDEAEGGQGGSGGHPCSGGAEAAVDGEGEGRGPDEGGE